MNEQPRTIVMNHSRAPHYANALEVPTVAEGQLIAATPDEYREDPVGTVLAGRRFQVLVTIPVMHQHRAAHPAGRLASFDGSSGYARAPWGSLVPVPPVQAPRSHPMARTALRLYQERLSSGTDALVWGGERILLAGLAWRIVRNLATAETWRFDLVPELDRMVYPPDIAQDLRPIVPLPVRTNS